MKKNQANIEASKVVNSLVEYLTKTLRYSKKEIAEKAGISPVILSRLVNFAKYEQAEANNLHITKWADEIALKFNVKIERNGNRLSFSTMTPEDAGVNNIELVEDRRHSQNYYYDYFYWSKENKVKKAILKISPTWEEGEMQHWSMNQETLLLRLPLKIRETDRAILLESADEDIANKTVIFLYKGVLNQEERTILRGVYAGIRRLDESLSSGITLLIQKNGPGYEGVAEETMEVANAYLFEHNSTVKPFSINTIDQLKDELAKRNDVKQVQGVYEYFLPSSTKREIAKCILEINSIGAVRIKGPDTDKWYQGWAKLDGDFLRINIFKYGEKDHIVNVVIDMPHYNHEYPEGFSLTTNRNGALKAARIVLRKISSTFEDASFEALAFSNDPNTSYADIRDYLSRKFDNVMLCIEPFHEGQAKVSPYGQTLFEAACYKAMRGQIDEAVQLLKESLLYGFSKSNSLWRQEFAQGGALDKEEIKRMMA